MTTVKPAGSSSGPGSRSPAASSSSRPQPSERPARTSGYATQATSRALSGAPLLDGRDPARGDQAPRALRRRVEDLDLHVLLVRVREVDMARRGAGEDGKAAARR